MKKSFRIIYSLTFGDVLQDFERTFEFRKTAHRYRAASSLHLSVHALSRAITLTPGASLDSGAGGATPLSALYGSSRLPRPPVL